MSNIVDALLIWTCYTDIVKDCKRALWEKFLQGFSYVRRRWSECQGNQSVHVLIPVVRTYVTVGSVRSIPRKRTRGTNDMTVTLLWRKDTAELGRESVTAMQQPTHCVRSALRRTFTKQPRRSTTSCRCHKAERMTERTSLHYVKSVTHEFMQRAVTDGVRVGLNQPR